ncbi:uncharacterized protein LOC107606608 [Arachis ipaensis]|uniref:uncharacterized protein LOC107606608 n=1 Tax=Arachis ipaensis TaxID=130454 RepID=UPI0007AF4649|nr:uncharacterized protein LOC107606608 [Arachis ipaensis]
MDESHHDLVNMLTHQMVTVLNPLLENTNTRIEQLNRQVNRISTVVNLEENDNQGLRFDNVNQNGGAIPNYNVHMPRHGQNADDMLERLRQNNLGGHYNLARNVEQILNRLGFNVGCLNRPYFVSAFPECVQQAELPRGWKIPKSLTKFSGEENESTVEHIARYTVEIGEVASNEYLKMRYFPSSLTKNAFTWFSNLRPNSIHSWAQLERNFHDQFFRGELKVSLTYLFSVKRAEGESIDTYLARFRNMRNKCFTPIPEAEVVKMATNGLEFGVRKKLVNQHTFDLFQLAERVRQIEQIKKEKENFKKGLKKVAYVDCFSDSSDSDEKEIYIAELRGGPPYVCKSLKPVKGKEKVSSYSKVENKTYSFDISKADQIFEVLL